jgi:hypothetical protein
MRKLTTKQVQRLHDAVLGTDCTIEEGLDECGLLLGRTPAEVTSAEFAVERLGIAKCVRCGTWRDKSPMDGDGVCEPCWESGDEE